MALFSPGIGAMTEGAAVTVSAGGAESNVAIGAAALGIRSAWLSRVGDDPLGRLVVDTVRRRGVDTTLVRVDATRPTGLMIKQPAPSGSRVYYYRAGSAASFLSCADVAGVETPRIVHVSGITAALSDAARELVGAVLAGALTGAATSFDVNYRPTLWPSQDAAASALLALARTAHIVMVGRDEAETLWGTATAEDVRELLPDVAHLVIKDGSAEAVEFASGKVWRVDTPPVDVVEPVGAGDAFAAGWIAGWLREEPPPARLLGGHHAAAAVLRSPFDTAVIHTEDRS
jgi:2-dehydro-3-deoxygluconokinase